MTVQEIELLIRVLRANGVTRFKSKEVTIRLHETGEVVSPHVKERKKPGPKPKAEKSVTLLPRDEEIEHTVDEVSSLLKLSDEELVDRMFPEPKAE